MTHVISVMIVDDHPLVRRAVHDAITGPDVEVVAEAATAEDALARAPDIKPDILLLDIELPGMSGIQCSAARTPPPGDEDHHAHGLGLGPRRPRRDPQRGGRLPHEGRHAGNHWRGPYAPPTQGSSSCRAVWRRASCSGSLAAADQNPPRRPRASSDSPPGSGTCSGSSQTA